MFLYILKAVLYIPRVFVGLSTIGINEGVYAKPAIIIADSLVLLLVIMNPEGPNMPSPIAKAEGN